MPSKRVFAAAVLCAAAAHADVTLRYQTKFQMNPTLPPQMVEQATKGMGTSMPPESVIQWKEGKGASSFGKLRAITDLVKKEITLIDPAKKQFATITVDGLADEMSKVMMAMPPEAQAAMARMKFTTESNATGRTETIQGIPAEERELTMTVEGPMGPPGGNAPVGPIMTMTFAFWMAKDDDVYKNPALRELKGYNVWAYTTMNPAAMLERMFQAAPGMGDNLGKLLQEMPKTMLLRSNITMRMPMLAVMMKQMPPEQNPFGKNFDPEAPIMTITQELAEISTASVPASVFVLPEGYQSVAAGELVKSLMEQMKQGGK
jgi:hypothetical protein